MCTVALLAAPQALLAQSSKIYRIGWLGPDREFPGQAAIEALRELGWVDGKNIRVEYRFADGQLAKLPELAADLVRLNVDVIVTFSGGVPVVKRATSTIPVVISTSQDPVRAGFVRSLARPGGNITGVSYLSDELASKRLELLKSALPRVSRVAVVWEPSHVDSEFKGLQAAAAPLGVYVTSVDVPRPARAGEIEMAIQAALDSKSQAVILAPGGFTIGNRRRLTLLAMKHRLPVVSACSIFADDGALLTYGPNPVEVARRTAFYVDKILRGARPENLPIELPANFELVINLASAKSLGITLPSELLQRADRLIRRPMKRRPPKAIAATAIALPLPGRTRWSSES